MIDEFDVKKYDVSSNLVIEASAGTGKTYNVVQIVEKLIATTDISKILIVTYTEKACGELKERIGKIDGININNANIYTIHSFCANTIKEFGLSANLCLSLKMEEKEDIMNFAKRYVRKGKIFEDITKIISTADIDLDTVATDLCAGCKKYYLDKDNQVDLSIIKLDKFDNLFDGVNDLVLNSDEEKFELLMRLNHSNSYEDFYKYFSNLEDNLEIAKEIFNNKTISLYNLLESNIKKYKAFNYDGNKIQSNKGRPDEHKNVINYFNTIKVIKKPSDYEILFVKYLDDFYKKYLEYKMESGIESFDDMIRYVREEIIHNDAFKEALRDKYKYAIIDEFQDTNQKQFDIFKNIFMTDNHNIIVVGDPKQSIYGFQGADVGVYVKAKDEISASGQSNYLGKNYRSLPSVVEGCNKIFEGVKFGDEDFRASKTSEKKEAIIDKAIYYAKDYENDNLNEYKFAKICAEQIINLCKDNCQYKIKEGDLYRNFNYSDFTVLVKSRSETAVIKNALRKSGIPFIMYGDKTLFNERECYEFIAILETLTVKDFTGYNRKYFYKAMLTKFFGYRLNDIKYDYFDKDDIYEMELILSWRSMEKDGLYEDLFESIVYDSRLQSNLSDSKYIETLSKFKQIANYCLDYLSNGNNIYDLINTLKGLNKDLEEDEDGQIVERGTEKRVVTIMTMHASKGLQFNAVICFGGFKGRSNKAKIFVNHKDKTIVYKSNASIKAEEDEEVKRLFYVAYTRAVYLLILPNYEFKISKLEELNSNIRDNAASYLKEISEENISYAELKKESEKILNIKTEALSKNSNIKTLINVLPNKALYKHSYTSLSHKNIVKDEDIDNKEGDINEGLSMFDRKVKVIEQDYTNDVLSYNNFPKGTKIGTALHEIFENIDFTNYDDTIYEVIKKTFKKNGIEDTEENISMAKNIVSNTINAKFKIINDSEFKLSKITMSNRLSEVSFDFLAKENNFLNGAVDLIIRHNGRFIIIDWKSDSISDTLESYNKLSDLKNAVDDRYSIQRTIYSYGLIKWLKTLYKDKSEEEIFKEHFGGIYYIFIKGSVKDTPNGIYSQTWECYKDLEESYNEIKNKKMGVTINGTK